MQDISRVITLMKSNPNTSNQCNGNYNLIQVTRRCYLNLNLKFYIMKTFILVITCTVLGLGVYGFIKMIKHLVSITLCNNQDEYFEDDISLGYTDEYYKRHNKG